MNNHATPFSSLVHRANELREAGDRISERVRSGYMGLRSLDLGKARATVRASDVNPQITPMNEAPAI